MNRDDWPDEWGGPRVRDEQARRRLDELLSLLSDHRRRDLLYHLASTDVTDVETLAAKVAVLEREVPVEEIPPDVRKQVQIELVHTHLPKLATLGVIEFDPRSETIRSREFPPLVVRLMETCQDVEGEE